MQEHDYFRAFGIKQTKIRYGGAQLPVGLNVQRNKQEILKAIDWAKDNEVFIF